MLFSQTLSACHIRLFNQDESHEHIHSQPVMQACYMALHDKDAECEKRLCVVVALMVFLMRMCQYLKYGIRIYVF